MRKKILPIFATAFATLFLFICERGYAQYTKLLDFNIVNGTGPGGSLISDGTYLYGVTVGGGAREYGIVFRIKPDGTGFEDLLDFNGANGSGPQGSLITDGTYLYGMTIQGGAGQYGLIFKVKKDGTGYQDLLDFNGTNGWAPVGSLVSDGTYLYGMTPAGGANGWGDIFKIKTDGTGFQDLLDFSHTYGLSPQGSLITDGTYLYGTTAQGGAGYNGNVFKIKNDGSGYQDLLDFNNTNGQSPYGTLLSDGTYLYGTTTAGGAHLAGNIFKIKNDGTGFQDLFDFDFTDGANATGALISDSTYLYGTASTGGIGFGNNMFGNGNVFKIKPDGTGFQVIFNFDGANGERPRGSLLTDGTYLYGTTFLGGTGVYDQSAGVIFKLLRTATLPLTLLNFTGQMQHQGAVLNWQTANELNCKDFTVERGRDGAAFTPLGSVAATNTPGTRNYSYTDESPFAGENFYRLKMVNQDGGFTYSGVVKLNNGNIQFSINVYPNPAGNSTTLGFTTPLQGKYTVAIANAAGKTLKRITGVSVAGANTLVLDTHGMASGVYMITYYDADGTRSLTLEKH